MSQLSHESSTLDFSCSLAAHVVTIERHYVIRISRAGKRLGKELATTDCTGKDRCGIAVAGEGGVTYDWSRCIYFRAPAGGAAS